MDGEVADAGFVDGSLLEGGRRGRTGHVRFSADVAREIVRRTVAGETQDEICADPAMPSASTLWRWMRKHRRFAALYARAKAVGELGGPRRGYCPVTAHEIAARVSEGESMAAIAREPAMPSLTTIFRWARAQSDFGEALSVARMAMAERFAEMGWTLAMEATPETAFLTQVRLKQLRWTCAILSPTTYGRLKASEPPAPPQGPTTILFRHFRIEKHPDPEKRQHRVVGYTPDPETMQPVREKDGPWVDIVDPVEKAAAVQALIDRRAAGLPAPLNPNDPPGDWRFAGDEAGSAG